ncbi:acyltransferase [Alicyclobacillus fastidiosus]|uniref:Acyltransferase n=2 Tax=Alicyclobacillus fastidiosus TaxID=392011 RepID=A0ABY6ZLE4_9BACL|nr:nitrilase-related carbon-nitrogen hydrolase [Alicyclobacillus fastidiosus]WAH43630.1 acyltransferase [Alicyclobacillus fastidiosus]
MSHVQTIAVAQISPKLGDVAANLTVHHRYIERAKEQGAQVVVFPELGLTGYLLQDLTLEVARRLDDPDIASIVEASSDIDIVFSFVEESSEHFFYISSVYASQGQVVHVHRKAYLPTYGMFDERRYVTQGSRVEPFTARESTAGMMICEDAWHVSMPYLLTMQGATALYVPASSPGRNVMDEHDFGSHTFWRQLLQMYAQLFGVHVVFANRVGYEDGVHFYGGSGVVGPDGRWIAQAGVGQEELLVARVDVRDVRRARYTTPLLRDERLEIMERHLPFIDRD